MDDYTECIIRQLIYKSEQYKCEADTLYFGGGTPSLLGAKRIIRIVETARSCYGLENAEITVEANPGQELSDFFREIRAVGVNRLSLGMQSAQDIPDEDTAAALYLLACEELENSGYRQYEISNFAKDGYQSRHNLKYWHCEEYLGFGPAAHSFYRGKRFSVPKSIGAFLRNEPPVPEGDGGSFEEFAMLALRLTEGLTDVRCAERFGYPVPQRIKSAAQRYQSAGLTECTADGFHFTPRGFLVSNALTAEIIYSSNQ
jgi:coproporphyrinogen III oxidase-like Fe-S oxidoreductase